MVRAKVLSFFACVFISFWSRSIKVNFVNRDIPDGFAEEGKNIIYAFWHCSMFLLLNTHRNSGILIPASESRDEGSEGLQMAGGLMQRPGQKEGQRLQERTDKVTTINIVKTCVQMKQAKHGTMEANKRHLL